MVVHACPPSIPVEEDGESDIEGHSWLCNKPEASLGYMKHCLRGRGRERQCSNSTSFLGVLIIKVVCFLPVLQYA